MEAFLGPVSLQGATWEEGISSNPINIMILARYNYSLPWAFPFDVCLF